MSQEHVEEQNEVEDVPEYDGESYQLAEFVEDAITSGEWNEHLKNKYVYSFKQGGRIISDLTASAYFHLALQHNISIVSHKLENTEKGVMAFAEAEKLDTGQKHPGVAYQPMIDSRGQFDVFCFQKALSKACRNSIKGLIPADMQIAAVEQLSTLTPVEAKALTQGDAGALPAPTPEPKEDTPQQKAMKRMFAVFRDYKERLEALGITDEIFWGGVRKHYDVESRNDMTIDQLNNVVSSLEYVNEGGIAYASWINDLVEPEESDGDESDDANSAIPF